MEVTNHREFTRIWSLHPLETYKKQSTGERIRVNSRGIRTSKHPSTSHKSIGVAKNVQKPEGFGHPCLANVDKGPLFGPMCNIVKAKNTVFAEDSTSAFFLKYISETTAKSQEAKNLVKNGSRTSTNEV